MDQRQSMPDAGVPKSSLGIRDAVGFGVSEVRGERGLACDQALSMSASARFMFIAAATN